MSVEGAVAQTFDAGSAIQTTRMYDAWGNLMLGTQPSTDPYGYNGQWGYYKDNETSLLLLTHRYYDPAKGRFLTRDPIGYQGGRNLYGYAQDSPVTQVDPSGLLVEVCIRRVFPVIGNATGSHWFINSTKCGAHGFGPGGAVIGWGANASGQAVNCYTIPTTPAQESCICTQARSSIISGKTFHPEACGGHPKPLCSGRYHWRTNNCQDFVQTVLHNCLGQTLPWTELGREFWPHDPDVPGVPSNVGSP